MEREGKHGRYGSDRVEEGGSRVGKGCLRIEVVEGLFRDNVGVLKSRLGMRGR